MQVPFKDIDPQSRVWIYQADRALSDADCEKIEKELNDFIPDWTAHSRELKAAGTVLHHRFLVIAVDESYSGASGCSIDKSVALVKKLENALGVGFFNRLKVCYKAEKEIRCFELPEFRKLWESGELNEETNVFNNLVASKEEFDRGWIQALGKTWLAQKIPQ